MNRLVLTATVALTLLLGGCATTIRSDVTTFHQWPSAPTDKTYVFEAPPAQEDTLELRSYQNLVRGELAKLGFQDAGANGKPTLTVSMRFSTADVAERVVLVGADPFFSPYYQLGFYRPSRFSYWGGHYSPYFDPFWYGRGPSVEQTTRHSYQRELQVAIKSAADGRRLFDVTVHNSSRQLSTPAVMPALVQSAFEGFPGPNGAARRIELKQNKG